MRFSKENKKILLTLWIVLPPTFIVVVLSALYLFLAPKKYSKQVSAMAAEYCLDEDLVFAVIRAESNFRADAVSSSGAIGLMQLLPSTAAFMAISAGEEETVDLFDAERNIELGCRYLSYLSKKFEDQDTLLAAYNAGEGIVRRWLSDPRYGGGGTMLREIPYRETRSYVKKVKKFYKCYKILYF